jgi:hypothetical protein
LLLFSPEVFAISDIISPYLSFLLKVGESKVTNAIDIIFTSVGYAIVILGAFIYNEIIVCNFWGLNENTWKAINEKANIEYLGLGEGDTNSIGDYEIDNNADKVKRNESEMSIKSSSSSGI